MPDSIVKDNVFLPEPDEKSKNKTAFIQIPFAFKDQVQAFLEELIAASDTEIAISNENIDALPPHGCFLVISLDKIEVIIKGLKACLSMEPDNAARNIKSEIRRTLTLLG
jgi:hypothetical protein